MATSTGYQGCIVRVHLIYWREQLDVKVLPTLSLNPAGLKEGDRHFFVDDVLLETLCGKQFRVRVQAHAGAFLAGFLGDDRSDDDLLGASYDAGVNARVEFAIEEE